MLSGLRSLGIEDQDVEGLGTQSLESWSLYRLFA